MFSKLIIPVTNIFAVFDSKGKAQEGVQKIDGGGSTDFEAALQTILNTLFVLMGIVAVFMIIYGGFMMMTSAGDPGKVAKGKSTIIWGVIGLLVSILATTIVNFVLSLL